MKLKDTRMRTFVVIPWKLLREKVLEYCWQGKYANLNCKTILVRDIS